MGIHTAAGTTVSIGTSDVATTLVEFQADTPYVPIGNIENAGETGSEAEIVTGLFLDRRYARKSKGTRDNGVMTLVVARDSEDPGYLALVAAEKTDFAYNFRVTLNDAPPGEDSTPSTFYFAALVASARTAINESNSIVLTTFALAISDEVFEVPASDGQ